MQHYTFPQTSQRISQSCMTGHGLAVRKRNIDSDGYISIVFGSCYAIMVQIHIHRLTVLHFDPFTMVSQPFSLSRKQVETISETRADCLRMKTE
jgi:hypothetical protein